MKKFVSVQYPLSELRYRDMGTGQNVLLITVDGLNSISLASG